MKIKACIALTLGTLCVTPAGMAATQALQCGKLFDSASGRMNGASTVVVENNKISQILPGAVNVDIYSPDFEKRLAALDKNAPLYLYCRSGGRSGQALSKAKALGFKKAVHLSGGILAWEAQGKKTVK